MHFKHIKKKTEEFTINSLLHPLDNNKENKNRQTEKQKDTQAGKNTKIHTK